MINFEFPEDLAKFRSDMHEFARTVFRPISRKYDEQEHEYPTELDMMRGMAHFDRKKKSEKKEAKAETSTGPRIGASIRAVISSEEISWGDPSFLISIPNAGLGNVALVTAGTDEQFEKYFRRYRSRHFVKPGITGLAQVSGYRGETAENEAIIGRVRHDIHYITHWRLSSDIYIILKTVWQVVFPPKSAY